MSVLRVVPLRRLPTDHPWFDYLSGDWQVQTGDLVTIPFRGQSLRGVVWEIVDEAEVAKVRPITGKVLEQPVLTEFQREMIAKAAEMNVVSLGHIIRAVMPTFTKARPRKKAVGPQAEQSHFFTGHIPNENVWWYRDRRAIRDSVLTWLAGDGQHTRVVLAPTIEEAMRLSVEAQGAGVPVGVVHGKLSAGAYTKLYQAVLEGSVRQIIGTGRALFLPYHDEPEWLIDQEEHSAHKQTDQQPRIDSRVLLESISTTVLRTTPAPSLRTFESFHPASTPPATIRTLASLTQKTDHPWITTEASDRLHELAESKKSWLGFVAHERFAGSVVCPDCGYVWSCSACHRPLSLLNPAMTMSRCTFCATENPLALSCPQCQHTGWKFTGAGSVKMESSLRQHVPDLPIHYELTNLAKAGLTLLPFSQLGSITPAHEFSGAIIFHGDALRNVPDYATDERAWQWLSRLGALLPTGELLVQTFSPEADFWQRWLAGNDQAWYDSELRYRHEALLPPCFDQWIAYWPGSQPELEKKMQDLNALNLKGVRTEVLPVRQKRASFQAMQRLLIQSTIPNRTLHGLTDWAGLFPTPWQLDTSPSSWL